jgi:hypothetical protein
VIASASSTWWSQPSSFGKVAIAYAAPVIFFGIFLITKLCRGRLFKRWWVKLDTNVQILIETLDNLELNRPVPRAQIELEVLGMQDSEPEVAQAEVQKVVSVPENAYIGDVPGVQVGWQRGYEADRDSETRLTSG